MDCCRWLASKERIAVLPGAVQRPHASCFFGAGARNIPVPGAAMTTQPACDGLRHRGAGLTQPLNQLLGVGSRRVFLDMAEIFDRVGDFFGLLKL